MRSVTVVSSRGPLPYMFYMTMIASANIKNANIRKKESQVGTRILYTTVENSLEILTYTYGV
jgi:hypothetical protein